MKTIVFTATFILCAVLGIAQNKEYSTKNQFYFNTYQEAEVYKKNNSKTSLKLNFNVLLNEMQYTNNGVKLKVGNIQDILFVKFADVVFVNYKSKYYRLVYAGDKKVYQLLDPDFTVLSKPAEGAYGTTSETSSVSKMSAMEERTYCISLLADVEGQEEIKIPVVEKYFVLVNDELTQLSKRNLKKIYPEKKEVINTFIKKNKISLKEVKDIEMLFTEIEK